MIVQKTREAPQLSDGPDYLKGTDMRKDQIAFARSIRTMEADECKRLNYQKMLAYAKFELRVSVADATRQEYEWLMAQPPEGGLKRNAKHRGHSRPNTGRVDAGTIAKGAVRKDWRGMKSEYIRRAKREQRKHAKVSNGGESYATKSANPIGGFIGNVA